MLLKLSSAKESAILSQPQCVKAWMGNSNAENYSTKSYCSDVFGYHRDPQTLVKIYRDIDICCSFREVAARENIRGSS